MAKQEPEDDRDRAMVILIKAMQKAKKTIDDSDFVPALVDFATMVGIVAEGEAGVRAMMKGMERRITDWKEGRFIETGPAAAPKSPKNGKRADARTRRTAPPRPRTTAADNVIYLNIEKSMREKPAEEEIIYLKLAPSLEDYVTLVNARFDKETGENPMIISEDNDAYIIAIDEIMTEAMRKIIRAEIPLDFLLASVADFMAFITLRLTGEEDILRARIRQVENRIDEWKAGEFPAEIV